MATEAYVDKAGSDKYKYGSIVTGNTEGTPTAETAVYSAAKTGELLDLKQDNITDTTTIAKDGTGLKVVDGSIGATQLDSLTKKNLLNSATTGNGLEITAGTADTAANISLKLNGDTLEATENGLHVKSGGITSTELASDAVTTDKILDKNVTKGKLSQAVQDSLDLADSGMQSVVINGTTLTKASNSITLDGSNLKITGYVKPEATGALAPEDTVNAALGKLEKGLEDAVSGGITEVQVNGTPLAKTGNAVNLKVATGTTSGTLKVNDVDIAVKDAVTYTDISTPENPNRKAIILDNHDGIFGKTTTGGNALIGMVSKYNVVDLGTQSLHTNLNTQRIVTVNNTQAVVTDQLLNQIVYGDGNITVTQESATDPETQFAYKKYKFTTVPNLTADSITLANSMSLNGRSVSGISAEVTGATNNGVLSTEAYVDKEISDNLVVDTAEMALVSDANKKIVASNVVSTTELNALDNISGNIQTQLGSTAATTKILGAQTISTENSVGNVIAMLADRIDGALGGTFNTSSGAWSSTIGKNGALRYEADGFTATTVSGALTDLSSTIGTAAQLTTGEQTDISADQTINENLKALSNAISGSGSDVVHKSGEENIIGTKTFKIVQKFEKTEGEGESAKTYETDIDGKTLTMGKKDAATANIVLNGNDGSATFGGNTTIGGTLGVSGLTTLSGTNGVKFDNADTTIKGFATTVDANSDNTTVATSKAVYDAIYGEGADVVHKSGIETITGIKTFTKQLTAAGGIYVDGASVLNGTMQVNDIATFSRDNGLRFGSSQIIAKDIVNVIDTTASESDLKSQLVTAYAVKDMTDDINERIDTETAERQAEDASLSNRINTEAAERMAEDASLSNRINTEAAQRQAEDAALSQRIAETGAAVEQEAATRAAADAALDSRIDTETAERQAEDASLSNRINTETAERQAEDASLSNRINTEAAERMAEDASLSNRINTETAERQAEDASLSNRINTEAAERQAEDASLSNRINTEAAERMAEDASLSNRINTEAAERQAEDASLSNRIYNEALERQIADFALDVRVTALEEESGGQSEAIKELQRDVKVQEVNGGLIRTQGNFVDGLAHTVGENVMILDDAMGAVDTDGHYIKASKDADGKIVTTMADNLENLDNHLYNASEALGGTFDDTTDKWSADLEVATGEDAVKYGNITVEKVTDALNQIITNVGTKEDLGDEFNGVAAKNSINKNIAALNDTIGNLKNLNDSTNITNGKPGDPGYKVPENVVDVLNNIDATLGTVHGLADKLREAGKYNGNLGDNTVESHFTAVDAAIGDRSKMNNTSFGGYSDISGMSTASALTSVASSIGTSADLGRAMNGVSVNNTVNKNIAAVNTAIGDISSLKQTIYASDATNVTDAIKALDKNMYVLDNQVNDLGIKYQRLRREFRVGMSSMAAMSAMAPNARADGNTQLTVGTGAYADHTAVAVGAYHWISNNLMVNAGVAWGDTDDYIYRMGFTYSF